MDQHIRFCATDAGRVAYAEVGEGPPLVLGGWWVSHLELDWERPEFRAFVEALAARRTVLRYDPLGSGLSDRPGRAGSVHLDGEVATLASVLDDAVQGPSALLGVSSGGCVAAALAAREPARVEALVLYGSYAQGVRITTPEVRETMLSAIRAHWGMGSRLLADVFLPGADARELDAFARYQREAADPEVAAEHLAFVYRCDVRAELPRIGAPVLVLHRRDDRAIPHELGRDLAASVPDGRLLSLTGAQHLPWFGDAAAVVGAVGEFLDGHPEAAAPLGSDDPVPRVAPAAGAARETDLSERELEVLRLIAAGHGDAQIAERLVLSPHTVHRHVANIRTKLREPSRAAAVAHASRIGLI
jgi:pimeloyl-ACP methyl ester carboxylesterase/DNA-binding CsgD family transcriptional regulator